MVHEDGLAVGGPARDAVRRFRARMVELGVDETHRWLADSDGPRAARVEVIGLQLLIPPVQEEVPVGRDPESVVPGRGVDHLIFQDQRALAGRRVYAIEVGRGPLIVRDVSARVAPDRPASVDGHVEIAHRGIREPDELRSRHVEGLAEREVPILVRTIHLQGLHPFVDRVPDVHVRRFVGVPPPAGIGSGNLLLDPEEHPLPVVAPRQRGAIAHHPPLGKSCGLGGVEDGGRRIRIERGLQVRERDQDVVLLAHLLDLLPLERRQRRAFLVPRQPAVGAGGVVERVQFPVAEVEDEQAVAVLGRGVDGEGEQLTGLVERDLADAAEQEVTAGPEVVNRHIHPGRTGRSLAAAAGRTGRGAARRCDRLACRPATAGGSPGRPWLATLQKQVRGIRREAERLDFLPRFHGPGREIAQLDALWRRRRGGDSPSGLVALAGSRLATCSRLCSCASLPG